MVLNERGSEVRDLIDTTEMYLKSIYELGEDGIVPLRARIADRLGHSGPTVSQTVSRLEHSGLVNVGEDRRMSLTPEGQQIATSIMRKHRLAERLLVDVLGMDWTDAHEEACRWEHVIGDEAADRLVDLLGNPQYDPYGNPIPRSGAQRTEGEQALGVAVLQKPNDESVIATVARFGEVIQSMPQVLGLIHDLGVGVGSVVIATSRYEACTIALADSPDVSELLTEEIARHIFIKNIQ